MFAAADAVLLDFDGPVTPLIPAPANLEAANAARAPMLARSVALDDHIGTTSDHLAVLRWAATNAPEALPEVEAVCDDAETAAASTAEPTHGAHDLLARCDQVGKPVVIVSNNAEVAIRAYLERWSLTSYIAAVIGRPTGRPDLMKPNTHTVNEALRSLRIEANRAVFVGDSLSDVEVSRAAGVPCIGYAKTPRRGDELREAGADAVTADIAELA
ncbi:HAD family hydrolase [Promicromonospora panici]|uniref:HAD family hydrolase n=1 Tax=Promicromonospora panici TaxID=2219658 RepID=UPI00101C7B29|nr:HAD hydrolase-like protein [Promicromonospora panici]